MKQELKHKTKKMFSSFELSGASSEIKTIKMRRTLAPPRTSYERMRYLKGAYQVRDGGDGGMDVRSWVPEVV